MNSPHVSSKMVFVAGDVVTQVTREWPLVAQAVNVRFVLFKRLLGRHLLAANCALVLRIRIVAALSMRRVVVSVDRWLVVERHVADLTLDTRWSKLKTKRNLFKRTGDAEYPPNLLSALGVTHNVVPALSVTGTDHRWLNETVWANDCKPVMF